MKIEIFNKENIKSITIIPGFCGKGFYCHIRYVKENIESTIKIEADSIDDVLEKIKNEIY